MISGLVAAARTVAKRLIADWLILLAALVTIVLATALLAAGPIYADAVTLSALQRTLADAPVQQSNVTVAVNVFPDHYLVANDVARATLKETFAVTDADVFAHISAESFAFMSQSAEGEPTELASFQYFESAADWADLAMGVWPSGAALETAVLASAASSLGLGIGDSLTVINRRDPSIRVTVDVVGIYKPKNATDPFWFGDELAVNGITRSSSFETYGPFVVTQEVMNQAFTRSRTAAEWRALPRYKNLEVSDVNQLLANVAGVGSALDRSFFAAMGGDIQGSSPFFVDTRLDSLLGDVARSLTVTRASVLALLVQLAILAGYALVLVAGLIADTRRSETALVRSRGASPGQIVGVSLLEAVVLVIPAVIFGPYIATSLLRILNTVGPLTDIGLSIDPAPTSQAFALAAIAGTLAAVALVAPTLRTARAFGRSARQATRRQTRSSTQRLGIDVALLALTVIAFWQLDVIGDQITARVGGRFGIDPLLVVAPALGLVTGAVLALRVVPLLAGVAEFFASSGRSTVAALASWQIARRPARYARSALLLMMAIGIGFFAAAYATTWAQSQRDQSAYAFGAEIVVQPNRAVTALDDIHLETAHQSVEGVTASMAVERRLGPISRSGDLGEFVILDTAEAAGVVRLRDDLGAGFSSFMSELLAARPALATVPLPGKPQRLGLTFDAIETLPEQPWPLGCEGTEEIPDTCLDATPLFAGRLRAVVQDGNDRLHRLDLGWLPVNAGSTRIEIELTAAGVDGASIAPVYPLRLVSIEIRNHLNPIEHRLVELRFGGISLFEDGWTLLDAGDAWADWTVAQTAVAGARTRPTIAPAGTTPDGALIMDVETGFGPPGAPVYFSLRPPGTELAETFPVVVSNSFLDNNTTEVGDELRLTSLSMTRDTGSIIGTVEAFPTVNIGVADAVLVDLPTFQMMGYEPDRTISVASEYWITTSGDDSAVVEKLLDSPVQSFRVDSIEDEATSRASDPVALGIIGALTVGFVAAAVFASVGFAVSATVSARERLIEFALLRALGLSPRQLASWLFLEQGALVIVSLGLGTLIGYILTATILPLISLTQDGSSAFPPVIVEYPWDTILVLELAVVAVLGLIVTLMTIALSRVGLGSLLRMGEQ